ncbi:hypothetical protein NECAME_11305 [Necator americanus]|uniref:Uncharacterized protein n=1 Tax=Necator americanus TaxID=51031 RepID=W2T7V5_NECAM|nr:hypothetical protein NECAME_11305 [Necator americanus]ETN77077.1 hypothetical protein NECAME_11305 [Necator americanus]
MRDPYFHSLIAGKPVTTSDIKDMLIRVFDASNKENINKVFTVQTKDNEIIFESADAKTARSADGRPENTVEIMVGSHGDKPALHTITNDSGGVEVKSKAQW